MIFTPTAIPVNPEVVGALLEAASTTRGRKFDDSHFIAALAHVGAVSQTLAAVGVDVPRARDGLARVLAALPRRPWYRVELGIAEPMRQAAAVAARAGLAELTGPFAFATLVGRHDNPAVTRALADAGFSLLAFRRHLAHGAVVEPPFPSEGPVRVVFHNDPFTSMDFVVALLCDVFGRDEETARSLMLRVHAEGTAALAAMDAGDALSKVERARARADEAELPLRLTVSSAL